MGPDNLTNKQINAIGNSYIKKNGETAGTGFAGFFKSLLHNNHGIAKQMQKFNNTIPQKRWEQLAKYYKQLPNNNGEIAKQILNLFNSAFKTPISVTYQSTGDVAKQMQMQIDNHYSPIKLELKFTGKEIKKVSDDILTENENDIEMTPFGNSK